MGVKIPAGTVDPSLPIFCCALSGAALTGKVAADFTSLWYKREGGAKVDVDPAGITEVADGEYRKTFPTAAAAIGANYVTIGGAVNGGRVLGIPIELDTTQGLLIAQREIDQTATPWQLVLKDRTTGVELYRFDLADENGDGVGAIDTFVAGMTTPPG